MLVYVWSRRNPFIGMNFFGIFSFSAPYLVSLSSFPLLPLLRPFQPWVLLFFSLLLGQNAMVDIFGWRSPLKYINKNSAPSLLFQALHVAISISSSRTSSPINRVVPAC
jgi:hypothetical protein